MPTDFIIRIQSASGGSTELRARLVAVGPGAAGQFERRRLEPGVQVLLLGDERDYAAALQSPVSEESLRRLRESQGRLVTVVFSDRTPLRRRLAAIAGKDALSQKGGVAIDLAAGRKGASPLWLLADGSFSTRPRGEPPRGMGAAEALVSAARWITARRTTTFERLFPPSPFHPDEPVRPERLSVSQAQVLLEQVRSALRVATVGGGEAKRDAIRAAQVRSAALTVLSHLLATVRKDPSFRAVADAAAAEIFAVAEAEQGDETARPALRAHAIQLLSLRGSALRPEDQRRASVLLRGLVRPSPPYERLTGPWRFAMCSAHEFHEGECNILVKTYKFTEVQAPADAPAPPPGFWNQSGYRVFEAPFRTPFGDPILLFARSANPSDENHEMGQAYFTGILINRHAQLGSFDMRASTVKVTQAGYKIMMNSQCAGLTTRFAVSRMFPDADIYSSWDSTYFNQNKEQQVTSSEGLDCFVAMLEGMRRKETHAQIEERIRGAQWYHPQSGAVHNFVQFIGPGNPLVVARFADINLDGRADFYDGFLDFYLNQIAEDLHASATPRDPGGSASQIGGEAANGLGWAAGSLNRVTQYSDIWAGLPGETETLYAYQAGGFYSHREPPQDVPVGKVAEDLALLPAVCRYSKTDGSDGAEFNVEVMCHAFLAHSGKEFKRLMCAAEAMWRAFDLGYLPQRGILQTRLGQRGAVLLTLAGLLEYPADQNALDGLWSLSLKLLNMPEISRSLVRACITEKDHDASNYYGSLRSLRQLVGDDMQKGDLERADALAFQKLKSDDPRVGRAGPLALEADKNIA